MATKKLSISDLIGSSNAIIQSQGILVYERVKTEFSSGYDVILDFGKISNLTSGFCHASIGQLYTEFPESKNKVTVIGIDPDSIWNEKISEAIDLAQDPEKAKRMNDVITALFN